MSSEYTILIILFGLAVFVGSEETQSWVPIKLKTYLRLLVDGVPMVMEYPTKIECFIEENKVPNKHRNKVCLVSTDKSSYPLIEEALMTATETSLLENDLTHTKESTEKVNTSMNPVDKYETNESTKTADKPEQTVSETRVHTELEVYTTENPQKNPVTNSIILPISNNTLRICQLTENLCVTKYVIKNYTGGSIEEIELLECPERSMETCQLDAVYKKYQSTVPDTRPMSIELTVSKCDCPKYRRKRSITKASWDTIVRNQIQTMKVTLMVIWILLITFVLLVFGVCFYSWTTRRNILCFNLRETCKSFFKIKVDHTLESISTVRDASILSAKVNDSMA